MSAAITCARSNSGATEPRFTPALMRLAQCLLPTRWRRFDNSVSASRNRHMVDDSFFTLADLRAWSRTGTWLAVVGHPIKHSLSPTMHNAALAQLAASDPRLADWRYTRFDIDPVDLPEALTLFREKRFRGLNLTVPHKVIAFDRVADIDPAAQPIGAINTLLLTDAGWRCFNTDSDGVASALHAYLAVTLPGAHVVLLGAGGAARGAAVEFLRQGVASLWIANRTRANLDTLLADLRPLVGVSELHGFSPTEIPADVPTGAVVVNATSAGLRADDPAPIDLSLLPRPRAVFDMIYNPPRTPLLGQAETLGLPHAHGLSMLAYQGARALEIWSGIPAARTAPTMLVAARAVLGF